MRAFINNHQVEILGDPHLGRHFVEGVPLARRGEREAMVWSDFERSLNNVDGCGFHVCMGDLFHKSFVSYDTILRAARAYYEATEARPRTNYVILAGNHDLSRDLEHTSAFDVFREIVAPLSRVIVLTQPFLWLELGTVFFPWNPLIPARDLVREMGGDGVQFNTAFGHWDIKSFGGNDDNLIPTKELAAIGVTTAYTGHIHLPQRFEQDGVDVIVTGSMQAYAHGEDATGDLYVTLTPDQIDPATVKNKCVRVLLEPGETFDRELDCLQLTIKRQGQDEAPDLNVSLGEFDMGRLFTEAFAEAQVGEEVLGMVQNRFNEMRARL